MNFRIVCFILFLLPVFFLPAVEPYLTVTLDINYSALGFATMMKPSDAGTALFPDSYDEIREEAIVQLLDEARWIFSGLIYGFNFTYIPGNKRESLGEVFELIPLKEIPAGDSGLEVAQVIDNLETLSVRFLYWPDEYQERRLKVKNGGGFLSTVGEGGAPMMEEGSRMSSLKDAVKQALRADLRTILYDRPHEVSGFVYLASDPQISIRAGEYKSRLKVLYKREGLKTFPLNY